MPLGKTGLYLCRIPQQTLAELRFLGGEMRGFHLLVVLFRLLPFTCWVCL